MNIFETVAVENGDEIEFRHEQDGTVLAAVPYDTLDCVDHDPMTLGIRPEGVRLSDNSEGTFTATVRVPECQENDNFTYLDVERQNLMACVPSDIYPSTGETVGVTVALGDVSCFEPETGIARKTRGFRDEQHSRPSIFN